MNEPVTPACPARSSAPPAAADAVPAASPTCPPRPAGTAADRPASCHLPGRPQLHPGRLQLLALLPQLLTQEAHLQGGGAVTQWRESWGGASALGTRTAGCCPESVGRHGSVTCGKNRAPWPTHAHHHCLPTHAHHGGRCHPPPLPWQPPAAPAAAGNPHVPAAPRPAPQHCCRRKPVAATVQAAPRLETRRQLGRACRLMSAAALAAR